MKSLTVLSTQKGMNPSVKNSSLKKYNRGSEAELISELGLSNHRNSRFGGAHNSGTYSLERGQNESAKKPLQSMTINYDSTDNLNGYTDQDMVKMERSPESRVRGRSPTQPN